MPANRSRLPAPDPSPRFRPPSFTPTRLDNGARVWTVSHRRAPVMTFRLLIPAGSADDPAGCSGVAGLTADVLDEGTQVRSDVELDSELMRLGAHLAVNVSSDATVVSLTTLPKHARSALELLVEVVSRPRFHPVDVSRVRDLRLARLRQMHHVPSAVAHRVFLQHLYPGHPYGHLAIGSEHDLKGLGPDDVSAFHRRWYGAREWTLVAVGDVPDEEMRDVATDVLSGVGVSEGEATSPVRPDPPPSRSQIVFVGRPNAVQSEIQLGHVSVCRSSPDYHALLVLNMVLGGQFVSRVNHNLREVNGYTYGAHTTFDWRVGAGPFSLQSSVQTDATADAVAEAIREIRDIGESRPATVDEIAVARAALTRGFPQRLETASQVARAGATLALHQLPTDDMESFVERIEAVSDEDVGRVAAAHLHPDRLLVVIVGSGAEVLPSLDRLGLGAPTVVHDSDGDDDAREG